MPDLAPLNPLSFLSPKNFEVEADDLVTISELGRGAYGVVEKVRHAQSGTIMAVKVSTVPTQGCQNWGHLGLHPCRPGSDRSPSPRSASGPP